MHLGNVLIIVKHLSRKKYVRVQSGFSQRIHICWCNHHTGEVKVPVKRIFFEIVFCLKSYKKKKKEPALSMSLLGEHDNILKHLDIPDHLEEHNFFL